MSTLEQLDLSYNQLRGAIPQSFGRLSTSNNLDLLDDQLSGSIPESLGKLSQLCQLTDLQIIDLAENRLTGGIPCFSSKLIGMTTTEHVPEKNRGLASGPISSGPAPPPEYDTYRQSESIRKCSCNSLTSLTFQAIS